MSSKAEQTCHTYFQQIAVNTRELPQQETFFCITHQKKPPFFHGLKPFHIHIIHIFSPSPASPPRSTGMAMVCCCPMFTTMPWSKPWAHKAICACDTTWHPWGNMWKNPGEIHQNSPVTIGETMGKLWGNYQKTNNYGETCGKMGRELTLTNPTEHERIERDTNITLSNYFMYLRPSQYIYDNVSKLGGTG